MTAGFGRNLPISLEDTFMRKAILSVLPLVLLATLNVANAYPVTLQAHNQRSNSGTLSTLKWKTCAPTALLNPCLSTAIVDVRNRDWSLANVTGSTAVWDWNPVTQILSSTGTFQSTSFVGSNPNGAPVISDKVVDLVINLATRSTTATSYTCIEGLFLKSVTANGCLNIDIGFEVVLESSALYNVGGNANCVQRTVGGTDTSTGGPRAIQTAAAAGVCDAVEGGYNLYTLLVDETATIGGMLRVSNGICIGTGSPDLACAGTNYLTFIRDAVPPAAVDDGPFQARTGVPESIDVLVNDTAFTNPVAVAVTTLPTKGTATVVGSPGAQAGIRINYTANIGTSGADSFVYTVTDADNVTTDTATVSINILAFGANDDSAATRLNTLANIPVGTNDLGFADPVTVTIVVPPNQGGAAVPAAAGAPAGQIVAYTPVAVAGTPTYTETFTYQMTDGTLTDTAVVTVTVNNAVPDAKVGAITISTAGVAPLNATGGFTAPGAGGSLGDGGTITFNPQGSKGTATVVGSAITYTVSDPAFFTGTDNFTYVITDSDGETDSGVVTVTISAATPALANGNITTASGTTSAPLALGITLGNGTQAQHNLSVSTQASKGSCSLSGTSVTYSANTGSSGSDSCIVTITDEGNAGQSDTGTIGITITGGGGGGGGGGGAQLPSSGAIDLWSLSLLAGLPVIRRRRLAA